MTPRRAGRSGSRTRAQGGFILLTVIAMLVVMVMLATAAAVATARMRGDQARDDAQLHGEIDTFSSRATLLYLLGTHRFTLGGLTVDDQVRLSADQQARSQSQSPAQSGIPGDDDDILSLLPTGTELRVDDTVYHGLGSSLFAFQGDHGRINVNWSARSMLRNWMIQLHVPVDQQGGLFAKLLDYQDPDDLYRLNGAETDQYRAAGKPPPPNRALLTPLELRHVLGWDKALQGIDDATLMRVVTANRTAIVNINSASLDVLSMLPGVTREAARRVLALRQAQPFDSLRAVYELLPTLPRDDGMVNLYPGDSGTLALWPGNNAAGTLLHWTLTPYDQSGRPWRIDYELRLPARSLSDRTPARKPQTPLLTDTPAAQP